MGNYEVMTIENALLEMSDIMNKYNITTAKDIVKIQRFNKIYGKLSEIGMIQDIR